MEKKETVNFLRGVPAQKALEHLMPMASEGYKKAIDTYGTQVLQYGHFNGFKPLRDLLGQIHQVHSDRVVAGNGGMEMITLLFKMLPLRSTIIVEEMTYDRVIHDAARYGHQLIGVELADEGVNIEQLRGVLDAQPVAAFYGIPFHQNPTGIDYTSENRKEVEALCNAHDVLCIWDICYESLRYDGNENDPITVSENGPVLVSSFTKTISPGTKCGYMILPQTHMDLMTKIIANTRLNPNLPTQAFISDFIDSGQYKNYLEYLRNLYRPRMEALNLALDSHFKGAFPAQVTGGFFSCIKMEIISPDNEEAFLNQAREAGVMAAPAWDAVAPDVRPQKKEQGLLIRLTFPACDPEQVKTGISALHQVQQSFG